MAPKISLKLPKLRHKRKYIARVPRRGGSVDLGIIEAKNIEDARRTLFDMMPEFLNNPRIASVIRSAKYIHLIDMETNDKIKIPNPLYSPSENEQNKSKTKKDKEIDIEDLQKMLNLELAETLGRTMVSVIGSSMGAAMNMVAKTMGEIMAEIMRAQAEALKQSLILQPQQMQQMQQQSSLEAVKLLLELIKNWPAIKQYGPEIVRYFKQQLQAAEQEVNNVGGGEHKEGEGNG